MIKCDNCLLKDDCIVPKYIQAGLIDKSNLEYCTPRRVKNKDEKKPYKHKTPFVTRNNITKSRKKNEKSKK